MATIAEAFSMAVQQHQAGNLQSAEALYRQILAADPAHADAQHFLGAIAYQMGNHGLAVDLMKQSIVLAPLNEKFHNNLGLTYQALGKHDEAIACYRQALRLQPALPEALNNLGNALADQGKFEDAIANYEQALCLRPDYFEAHNNLGNALAQLGKLDEAVASCQQALRLRPDYVNAHNNLATTLQKLGKLEEAEAHCREALRIKPDFAEAHNNLGGILLSRGNAEEAATHYQHALLFKPDYTDAHCNLAAVLQAWGQLDEAESHLLLALSMRPNLPGAHMTLGVVRQLQGDNGAAEACLREALRFDPSYAAAHSNLLLSMNYDPKFSAEDLLNAHRQWGNRHGAVAGLREAGYSDRDLARPLRVGYVSPDFSWHSVSYFLEPILANHDPSQVEAICYAQVTAPDHMTAKLKAWAFGWRQINGLSDAQAADLIRADRIDILVDLAGHTANSRLAVFAQRPAPLQITYLGYPCTTGLTCMDYCLTDAVADPPGEPPAYTEELVRLPGSFSCYAPPSVAPEVGPLPARQNGYVTLGSFHHLAKLNDEVLDLWCNVLRAIPTAHLLIYRHTLQGKARDNLLRRFTSRGISASRLELQHAPQDDNYHFGVYRRVDIALDAFPWSGHTTACESLWMGVPIVTLRGARHAARMVASVLTAAGFPQWIAETKEQFVDLAVRLTQDLYALAATRAGLRDRMRTSSLCDGKTFTRNLEAAYREMWQRWCREDVTARGRTTRT